MHFTEDEIIQILKLTEESQFDELHLESGDFKLIVRKGAGAETALPVEKAAVPAPPVSKPDSAKTLSEPVKEKAVSADTEKDKQEEGLIPIKAPLLGTFYQRSEPGAPAFVDIGSLVDEDTTVCIIEVMKVFSTVKAGIKGHISKINVENGELVEYGQPLFYVKPL